MPGGPTDFNNPPGLLIPETPRSSWVAMLGSLELLTIRPPELGDGGDLFPPLMPFVLEDPSAPVAPPEARGSGDKSRSDSGEEAYESRDVIGNRKSSERYSSSWAGYF